MNVITQFPAPRDYERDLRFQAMFEGAPMAIGICHLDGRILEANPALGRMLGYSPQELTGARAGELYPEMGRQFHSGVAPLDNSSSDTPWPEKRLLDELMRGERVCFEVEKRYRRGDGSELWGLLTVSLGRDRRRQPAFLIMVLADASERRRAEEHLREVERMEVMGRLAGGIAHDFNNLLTGILLYCDLLSAGLENARLDKDKDKDDNDRGWGPDRPIQQVLGQHVEEVRMAGEQGAALTQQLLAIARKQTTELRPIRINEIVASTKNLMQRLVGERVELAVVLDPMLDSLSGLVLADPAQLRQILLNLVLNARDAMPQGGTIRLSTRPAEFPRARSHGKVEPVSARRAVSLAVKDTGCGMDAETRRRLFEPFFTTKIPGAGTGLGLATVQRIVREAGGTIVVESEPGCGTSIEVFLPAMELATGERPRMKADSSSPQ